MRARYLAYALCVTVLAGAAFAAEPDARTEYERRAAERYVALFQALDRDKDGAVSRTEAKGDLNFEPRFDDMDVNRDGIVTSAELQRFIEREHGVRIEIGQR